MEFNEAVSYLRGQDNFLIVTHIRPDGDAHGSAAALCRALRNIGKRAFVYDNPETTENYADIIAPYIAPEGYRQDCTVTVDTADYSVFPIGFSGTVDLSIDHHGSNSGYAARTIVWPEKASCGELVMEIFKALCGAIDRETADLLYIAVSTDTGCFVYGNTRADTHRAAAELMEAGADTLRLNVKYFRKVSNARLKLEGLIYSAMRQYRNGTVTAVAVTLEMMRATGATENDCEDLAALVGRVSGSRVGITVRELKAGECKVSVRTGSEVDASLVCSRFGGGGHAMAAGCTISAGPDEAQRLIVEAVCEVWQ